MSGFDWKLPEDIREKKEMDKNELMRAAGDPTHPRHKEALEISHKNKMDRIEFFRKRREKYYTNPKGHDKKEDIAKKMQK